MYASVRKMADLECIHELSPDVLQTAAKLRLGAASDEQYYCTRREQSKRLKLYVSRVANILLLRLIKLLRDFGGSSVELEKRIGGGGFGLGAHNGLRDGLGS